MLLKSTQQKIIPISLLSTSEYPLWGYECLVPTKRKHGSQYHLQYIRKANVVLEKTDSFSFCTAREKN